MQGETSRVSVEQLERPRVRIVTINWNAYDDTARLLNALRQLDYAPSDTVVVDNASSDDSLRKLRAEHPEVAFVASDRNLGFGGGNNLALRQALAESIPFVWLLNNDAVPDPDALTAMMARMLAHPDTGAVGGVILEDDPSLRIQAWGGGRVYDWLAYARLNRGPSERLDFLTGACLLLRTEALRAVGLFDESFFLYWEDTDLCYRLAAGGWKLEVADARVRHTGSASTGRNMRARSRHSLRSYTILMRKHVSFPRAKSLCAVLFQSACKVLRGRFAAAAGCWEGWWGQESG